MIGILSWAGGWRGCHWNLHLQPVGQKFLNLRNLCYLQADSVRTELNSQTVPVSELFVGVGGPRPTVGIGSGDPKDLTCARFRGQRQEGYKFI